MTLLGRLPPRTAAAIAVLLVAATGCDTGAGLDDDPFASRMIVSEPEGGLLSRATTGREPPRCPGPPPGAMVDRSWAVDQIRSISEWVQIPVPVLLTAMRASSDYDEDRPRLLLLGSDEEGAMAEVLAAKTTLSQRRFEREFDPWVFVSGLNELIVSFGDAVALVGLQGFTEEQAVIMTVVVGTPDGGVSIVGGCGVQKLVDSVGEYARDVVGADPYDVLYGLATDDAKLDAYDDWERTL